MIHTGTRSTGSPRQARKNSALRSSEMLFCGMVRQANCDDNKTHAAAQPPQRVLELLSEKIASKQIVGRSSRQIFLPYYTPGVPPHPDIFSKSVIPGDFKSNEFVRMDSKGLAGTFLRKCGL